MTTDQPPSPALPKAAADAWGRLIPRLIESGRAGRSVESQRGICDHYQRQGWDPVLAWVRSQHGVEMTMAEGLTHVDQPPEALAGLRRVLEEFDAFTLGALHVVASITGSTVLALAVADGFVSGAHAFELSHIDENYQAEKWGEDAEAIKRTAALAHDLDKAVALIALSRSS